MYLRKLTSEPRGLLNFYNNQDEVLFVEGINFVFGKKTSPNASLNSIGKSCLLDLIDFCLLYKIKKDSRLQKAKDAGIFDGYKIVLEFEVDNKIYLIKRSFFKERVEFGELGNVLEHTIAELKVILHDLIFKQPDYKGEQPAEWFRNLLEFFLKIQRPKDNKFEDPIKYSKWKTASELNQYHLFFLGINNMLACDNFTIQEDIKKKNKLIKEIEQVVFDTYQLKISEAVTRISRLEREISDLEKALDAFQLTGHYENIEQRANLLTSDIKSLWHENYVDRKRQEAYKESFKTNISSISTRKISNLYRETNDLLAQNIKFTLDEAIQFRQDLAQSRESFLKKEIDLLTESINNRTIQIEALEQERAVLFNFLSETRAISDLTNVFYEIGQKQRLLSELVGQIKLYRDLTKQKAGLQEEDSRIAREYIDFIGSIKQQVSGFDEIFSQIYKSIFPNEVNSSSFGVDINLRTDAKLQIEVSFQGDTGQGKNQSKTMIYDLAIVLHSIKKGIKSPTLLVHDGIFNGMDKAHFVAVYEFLEEQTNNFKAKGKKFQYIVTINEEGTLSEKFGQADKVTPEKIEQEAIAVLSPEKKLFGKDFR